MPTVRDKPYIFATWLTKLMVGTNSCEWAAWFKAHNQRSEGEKVPSATDWTAMRIVHTALLNKVRDEYERQGYTVSTERQNNFFLRGRVATLAGIPDLIAVRGDTGVMIDAKAGKPAPWHSIQVAMYMWAVPQALQRCRGIKFSGLLYYQDSQTQIPETAVNDAFVKSLTGLIVRVSAGQEARRVPSEGECRYCDITHLDCLDRAASDERMDGETDEF